MSEEHIMGTYVRNICLVKGSGCRVWDENGKEYLDMIGGIGSTSIGHSNERLVERISEQATSLINTSNLFLTRPQMELSDRLCAISGMDKTFLSNSGTEAVETAIKLARVATDRTGIVAMKNGFHGRTMGSLSATWGTAYREPFQPLVPGFVHAEYGSMTSVEELMGPDTAAVIVEPVQGEAGVLIPPPGYLEALDALCRDNGVLLILDEVQTGNGRTGTYFRFQELGLHPDIVCTAKGLANGMPIGATLARKGLDLHPGQHGSTFGGNPLCCSGALATMDVIEEVLPGVNAKGEQLKTLIREKCGGHCTEVRGYGLMIGIEVDVDAKKLVGAAAAHGLLINAPRADTVRMLPPLTISYSEIREAAQLLTSAIEEVA